MATSMPAYMHVQVKVQDCERARLKWALSPKNVKLSFHHQQPRVGMEIHFAAKIS